MSNVSARQEPKFPWDIEVPENDFWNSLDHGVGRAFISCYTSEEVAQFNLDASLSQREKLLALREILCTTLVQKENAARPQELRDVDFNAWTRLPFSLVYMDRLLREDDFETSELMLRRQYEHAPVMANGCKNKSVLSGLGWLLEEHGKYAEAEATALEFLDWISAVPKCGPNSPQALGSMRTLAKCVWKQGRYSEGHQWIKKCETSIVEMEKTDFAKYVPEEKEELGRVVKELEDWKVERKSKM